VVLSRNKGGTVLASGSARPVLRKCRIEEAELDGIHFSGQAQGTIDEVEIIGSGGAGIKIEGGTNPSLRQVKVLNGHGVGIVVQALGGGSADRCEVRDNAGGDWEVAANARLARVGC
jgi:hypothetical protein